MRRRLLGPPLPVNDIYQRKASSSAPGYTRLAMRVTRATVTPQCAICGIAKSLGSPSASVVPLSGVTGELVVTVAWDISWYQYRVTPDSAQPVRLAERGHELHELEESFKSWNAHVDGDGRVVPDIARV